MATHCSILRQDFDEVKLKGKISGGLYSLDKEIKGSVSKFDWAGKTNEELKDELIKLDKKLVKLYPDVIQNIKYKLDDESPQFKLHKDLLYAIAELSGIKMV